MLFNIDTSTGTVPVRLFVFKSNRVKFLKLPNSEGIVPVNWLRPCLQSKAINIVCVSRELNKKKEILVLSCTSLTHEKKIQVR